MYDAWYYVAEFVHGVLWYKGFVRGVVDGLKRLAVHLECKSEVKYHAVFSRFVRDGCDWADFRLGGGSCLMVVHLTTLQ